MEYLFTVRVIHAETSELISSVPVIASDEIQAKVQVLKSGCGAGLPRKLEVVKGWQQ